MPMKLKDASGTSRAVAIFKMRDAGGTLRIIQTGKIRDADNALRTFYAPLKASITPNEVDASAGSFNPSMVVAGGPLTVVPIGGVAPYTYNWVWVAGGSGISISNPTTANAGFSATVASNQSKTGVVQAEVRDANGSYADDHANVTLTHIGYQ